MPVSLKQLKPLACHTRTHCRTCRTSANWRESVVGVRAFDCPHGITIRNIPAPRLDPPKQAKVAARLAICQSCPSMEYSKPNQNAVKCKDCGCGLLRLDRGTCPHYLWGARS